MIMPAHPPRMNNELLEKLIEKLGADVQGHPGAWKFIAHGEAMYCLTDEHHDRMRVMSPVVTVEELDEELLRTCLAANFDRALDARYCLNDEALWAAFLHPLASLTEPLFVSAVRQVAQLRLNFGDSFSSGELMFGG